MDILGYNSIKINLFKIIQISWAILEGKLYMKVKSKLWKQIIKSELLSIIFAIASRLYIALILNYVYLTGNYKTVAITITVFVVFCIITSIMFLSEHMINIVIIALSYFIYCKIFLSIILVQGGSSNDYGFGILGLTLEVFLGGFNYIIVVVASVIAVGVHKIKSFDLEKRDY
ncbi:hypothetical protein CLAUR_046030 (plasmid) [Clostridium felsineum]|nr:hypothetical protein CLAUR_046030 [Clostridium felsineum]